MMKAERVVLLFLILRIGGVLLRELCRVCRAELTRVQSGFVFGYVRVTSVYPLDLKEMTMR